MVHRIRNSGRFEDVGRPLETFVDLWRGDSRGALLRRLLHVVFIFGGTNRVELFQIECENPHAIWPSTVTLMSDDAANSRGNP